MLGGLQVGICVEEKGGCFCARLCALGYSQIAGLDYDESRTPVIQDVT